MDLYSVEKPRPSDLLHYGTKRHSGRYPWGSGDTPFQRSGDFLSRVEELRKNGMTEKKIADDIGLTTSELRIYKAQAKAERRSDLVAQAKSLRSDGKTLEEITAIMGFTNDSSVRNLLKEDETAKRTVTQSTMDLLAQQVKEKGIIQVGPGVELELNVSRTKLDEAIKLLEADGVITQQNLRVAQVTNPGKYTTVKVIGPADMDDSEVYSYKKGENVIHTITDYTSSNGGDSYHKSFYYPESLDSSRLKIHYADEKDSSGHTGLESDGLIQIRRGCKDLDLGDSHYAQVRIMVDGTHYLKGMAVYSDDMPKGIDVIFNTNKTSEKGTKDVLKKIKDDPDNPFGSLIKEHGGQSFYDDPKGKYTDPITGKKQSLSLINKRAEEGDWDDWGNRLPAQFLSKQPMQLINQQLKKALSDKQNEYDSIMALTNPTLKKSLLEDFADSCESDAVKLQAAALPRQHYQVILPVASMKETEVYAPNYTNGEKVALIRYPHGGTFEIPILTVNNKQKDAQAMIGKNPKDAVCINSKVAERLSGADFDGDTVMVIPTNGNGKNTTVNIRSTHALRDLEGFDPKVSYGGKPEGTFKKMTNTQTEMGVISNLITDMTLKGATEQELARAVKHSMVVIDAEKHSLDYKQSEKDNGIAALKAKYQGTVEADGSYHEGAATLISRSKSKVQVTKRTGSGEIDPETGEITYREVHETYVDKNGKVKERKQDSTRMAETKDAHTLSSGTKQEEAYANYANALKAMANSSRKAMISTKGSLYKPAAKAEYAEEVKSLELKVKRAAMNAPRERQAQLIANSVIAAKKASNPDLASNKKELKKESQRALTNARLQVGAKRHTFDITDKEWEAIQSGAVTASRQSEIFKYADSDRLRSLATPKGNGSISKAQISRIKAYATNGYTTAEIAKSLGISTSTVSKYLN